MKKILLNNLSLKLLALFLGVILWIAVMYNLNPKITKDFTVKVNIINSDVLTEKGWKYTIDGSDEVKVTVKAQSLDMAKIDENDIYLYVDLRYLSIGSGTERQGNIQYTLKNSAIDSISLSREYMIFNLEEIVSREFKVDVQLRGDVAENYTTDMPTAVPDSVTIIGPRSQVEQVTKVVYYLTLDDAVEDIYIIDKPMMLGADGEVLTELDDVLMTPETVQICLPIYQTKTVDIECDDYIGEPATGYGISQIILDIDAIKIAGYKAILSNIVTIQIPAGLINVEGIATNQTYAINLEELELPEGVKLLGTDHMVNVTVKVEKKKQNNFRLQLPEDITIKNKAEGYTYSFDENSIYITVEGISDVLSTLESANIISSIDVSGLSEGIYNLPLSVILPDDISLVSNVYVNVVVSSSEEPTEPTEPQPSVTEPTAPSTETTTEVPENSSETETAATTTEEPAPEESTETSEETPAETSEDTGEIVIITLPAPASEE